MPGRQRISETEKYVVVGIAAGADVAHMLLAAGAVIPYAGLLATISSWYLSFLTTLGFGAWYMAKHTALKRYWIRIALNILLLFFQLIFAGIPFMGTLLAFATGLFFTINIYLLIRAVQKEDTEYNKKMEQATAELQQKALTAMRNRKV